MLRALVRRLPASLRSLITRLSTRPAPMRFPSFDAEVGRLIADRGDYARHASLALALRRVLLEDVPGDLAEVGVYRGDTSVLIRATLPTRRLWLFDTFEGFPADQLEDFQRGDGRFRDTSVGTVVERLGAPGGVIVQKGRVPGTLSAAAGQTFAFVLLDMDLYEPTARSLEFFYPRLASGGYVFVHDFNNAESNWACRRALTEFLETKPERLVELPDVWGSAVFRKL